MDHAENVSRSDRARSDLHWANGSSRASLILETLHGKLSDLYREKSSLASKLQDDFGKLSRRSCVTRRF